MPEVSISSAELQATISSRGAELQTLRINDGRDLLWNGDPEWWAGRSPLLFPIVGRLPDDTALVDGRPYRLPQHGFARTSEFDLLDSTAHSCRWLLRPGEAHLRSYPRAFALMVDYGIDGLCLVVTATVLNTDTRPMPFSFGFHPAFRWPLSPGAQREAHALIFSHAETASIRRPLDGLLGPGEANPVVDRQLPLRDSLFESGALVFDQASSRSIRYTTPSGPQLAVDFPGMPHLGIWTKPGAPFICIEPWHGFAAPAGFHGQLGDKPGIINLAPGDRREFQMTITLFN